MKGAIHDALQRSIDAKDEKSLGDLYDKPLYEGFPLDTVEPPAITYGVAQSGARGLLTVIVYGGEFKALHARIKSILTEQPIGRYKVKYMTCGPVQWDERLRVFAQRASYLIKTLPVPGKSP